MKRNNLAGAPKAKSKRGITAPTATNAAGERVEVETRPAAQLTRRAIQMARQHFAEECEAIGQEASKLEGYKEEDGWKLDLQQMVWFRPKDAPSGPKLVDEAKKK